MKKIISSIVGVLFVISFLHAKEKKGWLGVYAKDISEEFKIALGIDHGVIVSHVVENSPAEKAGIEKGDIIFSINGEKITDVEDLTYIVKKNPDKEVKIEIIKRGKKKVLKVKLGEREEGVVKKYKIVVKGPEGEKEMEIPWFEWKVPEEIEKEVIKVVPPYREEIEKLKEEIKELREKLREMEKKSE